MRLVAILAGAAVIAGLTLVAAPGSAGSRAPMRPNVDPAVLQPLRVVGSRVVTRAGAMVPRARLAATAPAASYSGAPAQPVPVLNDFVGSPSDDAPALPNAAVVRRPVAERPHAPQPAPVAGETIVLHGIASWYDNGTTAMRWTRGAHVRICGPGGCVLRRVTDYGPDGRLHPERVVDLMPVDFVAVCGCSPRIGLTTVTVEILD
ncbi:MAG TPA: hypothetical protein VIV06_11190 [Candidatus Limnocylindrales bacterium]